MTCRKQTMESNLIVIFTRKAVTFVSMFRPPEKALLAPKLATIRITGNLG